MEVKKQQKKPRRAEAPEFHSSVQQISIAVPHFYGNIKHNT